MSESSPQEIRRIWGPRPQVAKATQDYGLRQLG